MATGNIVFSVDRAYDALLQVLAVSIDHFLVEANLSNMFSIMNVFQPYDGHNSMHPI